jgi:hypothetical protein
MQIQKMAWSLSTSIEEKRRSRMIIMRRAAAAAQGSLPGRAWVDNQQTTWKNGTGSGNFVPLLFSIFF